MVDNHKLLLNSFNGDMLPLVSIVCITYNHEPYIRQCLDGFMMQQTDFPFEVLIHDDASTDRTAEIIREYAAKYPDIIKPIYQTENQYSKGVKIGVTYLYPRAKGKYIAECEGDDYWTDPLKLQKQVDFLEEHPDYSLCFHRVTVKYEDNLQGEDVFAHVHSGECSLDYMLKRWTIPTCSVVFRRVVIDHIPQNPDFKYSDNVLFLTCFVLGRVFCNDGILGVYRRNRGGWTMNKTDIELLRNQYIHYNALLESFPSLDLQVLESYVFSYACDLIVFDRNLPPNLKDRIMNNFYSAPIKFIICCLKLMIKSLHARKS